MISDKIKGSKRISDESFDEYKQRRRLENNTLNNYLRGKIVHVSKDVLFDRVFDEATKEVVMKPRVVTKTYTKY
jgi:hypothetical protein